MSGRTEFDQFSLGESGSEGEVVVGKTPEAEPNKPVAIVIRKRADDLHASINGKPEIWGCGKSYYATLGNLISNHPEEFNIRIEFSNDDLTQRYLSSPWPRHW